jgi:hypothetical protein
MGDRRGQRIPQMAFQMGDEVYLLKFLRDAFHPLPAERLEGVTGAMVGLSGNVQTFPIRTTSAKDPVAVFNQAVKKLPHLSHT